MVGGQLKKKKKVMKECSLNSRSDTSNATQSWRAYNARQQIIIFALSLQGHRRSLFTLFPLSALLTF